MGAIAIHRRKLGRHPNEGARLLWDKVRELGLSIAGLTKALGSEPGMANRWLWCDTRPSPAWADVLEDQLGIPHRAWRERPSVRIVVGYQGGHSRRSEEPAPAPP